MAAEPTSPPVPLPAAAEPAVAVVIVTYNSADLIGECLDGVVRQLPDDGSTAVVFDNHSSDGTADLVEGDHPEVLLIRSDENLGFGRACNAGVEATAGTSSRYVLLVNPDTVAQPGCIDALLDLARRRPAAGIYGGRTLDADGEFDEKSCWGRPTIWSLFCFASGLSSAFRSSAWLNPEGMGDWRRDSEREVDVVSGCLLMARRDLWDELGGFDERFFMYGEDADLNIRAAARGHRPMITPDAQILHYVSASSSHVDKMVMLFRGKTTLVRKLWSGWSQRLALGLLFGGIWMRARLASRAATRLPANAREADRARPKAWADLWRVRAEWRDGWTEDQPARRI